MDCGWRARFGWEASRAEAGRDCGGSVGAPARKPDPQRAYPCVDVTDVRRRGVQCGKARDYQSGALFSGSMPKMFLSERLRAPEPLYFREASARKHCYEGTKNYKHPLQLNHIGLSFIN